MIIATSWIKGPIQGLTAPGSQQHQLGYLLSPQHRWDMSGMALCLTLNSDPPQKKCRLVTLQYMYSVILLILCIRLNLFTPESKFTDQAVTAEDHISGLCFCIPSTPCYDRDLGRAVSIRDLPVSIRELPE